MTRLSSAHRDELNGSAIDPVVVEERGYRTLQRHNRDELTALGIGARPNSFPGLLLPIYRATGERISVQFKPAQPIAVKGRSVKYLSPRGRTNCLDVHPRNHDRIRDLTIPLLRRRCGLVSGLGRAPKTAGRSRRPGK